ncbi:hypothetical protein GLAREA_05069 [Glarea lozoyensis ATCC 20868]|uniref:Uncharacterized protein n=1 Tax=Glarea lozoyensis (strain ATCC 20868 / MF5171) TaxID=1116229 RepID=S3DB94_GLAL2|nr:uncharacterized protein GLAREA_05069 [Glarea lozoyensis ATCC 20868]EPE35732.1 hypothetical protein GLAREA_05069 [Glarea lozoyensis ATCC 20868]
MQAPTVTPVAVSFFKLTRHIFAEILASFDNFQDLHAAMMSHRAFYHAFKPHRNFILSGIILNQIPVNLFPLAWALFEAKTVDLLDNDAVKNLLEKLNLDLISSQRNFTLPVLPTSDFVMISKTHAAVQDLRQQFAKETIPLFEHNFGVSRTTELSPNEATRIERALYRFQLASDLYVPGHPWTPDPSYKSLDWGEREK